MGGSLDEILKGGVPVRVPEPEPDAVMEPQGPCAWCFPKNLGALDVEDGPGPVVTLQYMFFGVRAT
jgi:hypothetical protein